MVYLSDVRLGAHAQRLYRRDHALDLHSGIRSAPAALRLDSWRTRITRAAPASIRICPAQPYLLRGEQAQTYSVGERQTGERLGRSAHGDHFRFAPARRDAKRVAHVRL